MRTLTADAALAAASYHHALSRPGTGVEAVATALVGLHATSPVSAYLSLRARLPGFSRSDLDGLMWRSWRLARFRAMRLTMFVFPHDLLEIAAAATRHIAEPLAARWLRDSGMSRQEFDRLVAAVDDALADGPRTVRDLRRVLDVPQSVDLPGVVGRMCDVGRLVGGAPPRSWRSSVREYHRWSHVLPDVDLRRWDEEASICELVDRYVGSYGPVTVDDISWWTGITKGRCRAALDSLGARIKEVAVEGWPGPLYGAAGLVGDADPGSEVIALPLLDPYVQGYRQRGRFLDEGHHEYVYDGGGNSTATLVSRGRIIGVWQVAEKPARSVRYHLFGDRPRSVRRAAVAQLAAVGSLYFDCPVDVAAVATMKPLNADGGRSASHPLDSQLHRASRRRRAGPAGVPTQPTPPRGAPPT